MDNADNNKASCSGTKEEQCSATDPESGWFHKGEHKEVFAYSIQTACDKNVWILGFTVNRRNLHDSRTFKGLYDKIKNPNIRRIIVDADKDTQNLSLYKSFSHVGIIFLSHNLGGIFFAVISSYTKKFLGFHMIFSKIS